MLVNILPEKPLKSLADNGSSPALSLPQCAALMDGLLTGGITFGSAVYGPNLCTGATATASDQFSGLYNAPKAADGGQDSYWESSGNPPHWWRCQFASAKAVAKVRLLLGHTLGLKDFTIEGSNDNANWTVLYTGQAAQSTAWQEFAFANATAFLYARINGSSVWSAGNSFRFVEVEMMESVPGSLHLLLDATGGGTHPVREIRYHTTESDPAKVTIRSSADGASYTAHTVTAGSGYVKAAVSNAVRYVTIDHLPSAQQTAHEVELYTQRCVKYAAPVYGVVQPAMRHARTEYYAGFKAPAEKSAAPRYGVRQPAAAVSACAYHLLAPSHTAAGAVYHLLQPCHRKAGSGYHVRPPAPLFRNAANGYTVQGVMAAPLETAAISPVMAILLMNGDAEGGLKMGDPRVTTSLSNGGMSGGTNRQGAEAVTNKWFEIKSSGILGTGIEDDAQSVFTPVGGDAAAGGLALGEIPSARGRILHCRVNVPAAPATAYSLNPRIQIEYEAQPDPGFGGGFGSYFGG